MLKAYASYFVSFLLEQLLEKENIERIILFGSVARGEEIKESDVDIFIEVKKKNKKIEKEILDVEKKFYESREAALFKVRGVDNKLSIKIGKLIEWKQLYKSVASTGIILYGPYEAKDLPSGVQHKNIIFWDTIEKNRGAFLNKLYGFRLKKKSYDGILKRIGGERIGKSCIMIPSQYRNEVLKVMKEYHVHAKIIDIFT